MLIQCAKGESPKKFEILVKESSSFKIEKCHHNNVQ